MGHTYNDKLRRDREPKVRDAQPSKTMGAEYGKRKAAERKGGKALDAYLKELTGE